MPLAASASITSSSSRRKACPRRCPAARRSRRRVMTTFMSVSAASPRRSRDRARHAADRCRPRPRRRRRTAGSRLQRAHHQLPAGLGRATKAPVIAAVRVPPSACSTSQSSVIVRSPSAGRSIKARSERPIRRWISWVRPHWLPRAASRCGARVGRARQHAVFGGDPALALAAQERRHFFLDTGGAEHACRRTRSIPSLPRAACTAVMTTGRSASGRASGRSAHVLYSPSQRSAAAEVLSLAVPRALHRALAELERACRAADPGRLPFMLRARSPRPSGSPRGRRCTPAARRPDSIGRRRLSVMSGRMGSPPRQHSTKLRIG